MRKLFLIVLTLSTTHLLAQKGYVKTDSDSMLTGYLKYYVSFMDGHQGIELWRTKKDKSPLKIPKSTINEYAIKKDTFKVFHHFKPFQDTNTYFEMIDAKLKSRGRVNLYIIRYSRNTNSKSIYTGGGLVPGMIDTPGRQALVTKEYTYLYILEDKETGFCKAMPRDKDKLKEALIDFFPRKVISNYNEVNGKIDYKEIPELVRSYNLGKKINTTPNN